MTPDLSLVLSGLINSGLIQIAKRIQSIPLVEGQTARLRTVGVVLSIIATLVTALASGTLSTDASVANLIDIVSNVGATFLVSHMSYFAFFRKDA